MAETELFVFLLFAVAILVGLDPDIVFFVFLPPLLYAAAITVSWRLAESRLRARIRL